MRLIRGSAEDGISNVTVPGSLRAARRYCLTDRYWQSYFDINKTIAHEFG